MSWTPATSFGPLAANPSRMRILSKHRESTGLSRSHLEVSDPEIGTGRSTRDACSGCASLMDARLAARLMWLASSSYKSVARPALTVNNYYYIDIIRMGREGVEKARG